MIISDVVRGSSTLMERGQTLACVSPLFLCVCVCVCFPFVYLLEKLSRDNACDLVISVRPKKKKKEE